MTIWSWCQLQGVIVRRGFNEFFKFSVYFLEIEFLIFRTQCNFIFLVGNFLDERELLFGFNLSENNE